MDTSDTNKLIEVEIMDRTMLDILELLPEETLEEFEMLASNLKNRNEDHENHENHEDHDNEDHDQADIDIKIEGSDELKNFLQMYNINLEDIISRNREAVIHEIESV